MSHQEETPNSFRVHSLVSTAKQFPADTDLPIAALGRGNILLINVPPHDEYQFEAHAHPEFIFCLDGTLRMEDEQGARIEVQRGDMVEVPPGLRHKFSSDSSAVVATLTQSEAVQ